MSSPPTRKAQLAEAKESGLAALLVTKPHNPDDDRKETLELKKLRSRTDTRWVGSISTASKNKQETKPSLEMIEEVDETISDDSVETIMLHRKCGNLPKEDSKKRDIIQSSSLQRPLTVLPPISSLSSEENLFGGSNSDSDLLPYKHGPSSRKEAQAEPEALQDVCPRLDQASTTLAESRSHLSAAGAQSDVHASRPRCTQVDETSESFSLSSSEDRRQSILSRRWAILWSMQPFGRGAANGEATPGCFKHFLKPVNMIFVARIFEISVGMQLGIFLDIFGDSYAIRGYPALTQMLLSVVMGALISALYMILYEIFSVLKYASLIGVVAVTVKMFLNNGGSHIISCMALGFSIGFGIPAIIILIAENNANRSRLITFTSVALCITIGLLVSYFKFVAYAFIYIIALVLIFIHEEDKNASYVQSNLEVEAVGR